MSTRPRPRLLAAALVLTTAACASDTEPAATPANAPAVPAAIAWGLVGDTAVALVAADGTTRLVASPAVATPDGRTVVRADTVGDRTTVRWLDGRTGVPDAVVNVPGHFRPAVVAADGHAVALVDGDVTTPTRDPRLIAPGRDSTTIAIAHRDGRATTVDTMAANVVPEAFTGWGGLALVEYLPAIAPERYRVRIYDVEQRGVSLPSSWTEKGVTVDEEMRGYQRTHAAASDGTALYTLYSQPVGGAGHAFVHALSLEIAGVYCLDLPESAGLGSHPGAVALSPDNRTLYVLSATGALVEVAVGQVAQTAPTVTRQLDLGVDADRPTPVLAVDDTTVHAIVGTTLLTVDRATARITARAPLDGTVTALRATPDGLQLVDRAGVAVRTGDGTELTRTKLTLPDGFGPVRALYPAT